MKILSTETHRIDESKCTVLYIGVHNNVFKYSMVSQAMLDAILMLYRDLVTVVDSKTTLCLDSPEIDLLCAMSQDNIATNISMFISYILYNNEPNLKPDVEDPVNDKITQTAIILLYYSFFLRHASRVHRLYTNVKNKIARYVMYKSIRLTMLYYYKVLDYNLISTLRKYYGTYRQNYTELSRNDTARLCICDSVTVSDIGDTSYASILSTLLYRVAFSSDTTICSDWITKIVKMDIVGYFHTNNNLVRYICVFRKDTDYSKIQKMTRLGTNHVEYIIEVPQYIKDADNTTDYNVYATDMNSDALSLLLAGIPKISLVKTCSIPIHGLQQYGCINSITNYKLGYDVNVVKDAMQIYDISKLERTTTIVESIVGAYDKNRKSLVILSSYTDTDITAIVSNDAKVHVPMYHEGCIFRYYRVIVSRDNKPLEVYVKYDCTKYFYQPILFQPSMLSDYGSIFDMVSDCIRKVYIDKLAASGIQLETISTADFYMIYNTLAKIDTSVKYNLSDIIAMYVLGLIDYNSILSCTIIPSDESVGYISTHKMPFLFQYSISSTLSSNTESHQFKSLIDLYHYMMPKKHVAVDTAPEMIANCDILKRIGCEKLIGGTTGVLIAICKPGQCIQGIRYKSFVLAAVNKRVVVCVALKDMHLFLKLLLLVPQEMKMYVTGKVHSKLDVKTHFNYKCTLFSDILFPSTIDSIETTMHTIPVITDIVCSEKMIDNKIATEIYNIILDQTTDNKIVCKLCIDLSLHDK